jgi:hypothetical protein
LRSADLWCDFVGGQDGKTGGEHPSGCHFVLRTS